MCSPFEPRPRSFDPPPRLVNPNWADEACIHCNLTDYHEGEGIHPRTIVICSGCGMAVSHVECHQKACGTSDTAFADIGSDWFCSRGCQHVYQSMKQAIGAKIECQEKSINIEWTRHKPNTDARTANQSVDAAFNIFRSAFGRMESNGRDLLKLVTYSTEDPDDYGEGAVDYSSFFVVVLRKGSIAVSAAVMRVRGQSFAELPFISTKEGYRGEGHCRRLVSSVERRLISMGVKHLLIPSLSSALGMWSKFGYQPLSDQELEDLGESILQMDPESSIFLKKRLDVPIPQESQKRPAALMTKDPRSNKMRKKHDRGNTTKRGKGFSLELDDGHDVEDSSGSESESEGSEEEEEEEEEERQKIRKKQRVMSLLPSSKSLPLSNPMRGQGQGGGRGGSGARVILSRPKPPPLMIKTSFKKPPRAPPPTSRVVSRTSLSYLKPLATTRNHLSTPSLFSADLIVDLEEWLLCSDLDTDEAAEDEGEDKEEWLGGEEQGGGGEASVAHYSPSSPIPHLSFEAPLSLKRTSMRGYGAGRESFELMIGCSPTKHLPSLPLPLPLANSPLPHASAATLMAAAHPLMQNMQKFKSDVLDKLLPSVVHCLFISPSPCPSPCPHSSSPAILSTQQSPLQSLALVMDEPPDFNIEDSLAIAAEYAYPLDD